MKNLGTLISQVKESDHSLAWLLCTGVDAALVFAAVKLFGRLAYDGRYLQGKWFEHLWSPGWRWAFNGMVRKLFTGHGRGVPWPIGPGCDCGRDVEFSPDEINNFQVSSYYQAFGGAKIWLGHNVWIARGCCLITTNHDPANPERHQQGKDIRIGDNCWLGANVVIMPGVELGPNTVVGANAVVTKSFSDGHCVLVGVPAKPIHRID
ncbi:acyltransferase [Thermophilibacter sp. ZX-H3]|uniref:acyltransferase n=1 Tax=unclassified Thermophilibacter TaxID=2847308 RepID=UPI0040409A18